MEADAAPLSPEQFQLEVDLALRVLKKIEGVSAVKSYPETRCELEENHADAHNASF